MQKNIYVKAYTTVNLGDDLFIKILCDRYKNTNFYIYANRKYKKIFKNTPNIKVYSFGYTFIQYTGKILHKFGKKNFLKIYIQNKIIDKCDAIVTIGGSMFIQKGLTKTRTRLKIEYDKQMLECDKPLFLIGSNFGPYENENYYSEYKKIFKKYKDICFREKYSYELFKELENVRMAKDVIFSYKQENEKQNKNQKVVLFSIIDFNKKGEVKDKKDVYTEKIIDLINVYTKKDYKVILMGFCNLEGDKNAIKEILNNTRILNKDKIETYYYNGNIEECLEKIEQASKVIASRFHSMILGYRLNKQVYTFAYGKKTVNVLKDLGMSDYSEINQLKELNAEDVFYNLENKKEMLNMDNIIKDAELQFKILDQFLGENI